MKKVYYFLRSKLTLTSVLKQSRVLIERLVKQRFNISKLGVTFRNSKWANYAKGNSYTPQLNLLLWFYSLMLFVVSPLVTSFVLFGMDFTTNLLFLLKLKINAICVLVISYSTLFLTFFKKKIIDNFIKTNFDAANKFIRFQGTDSHSCASRANVLNDYQTDNLKNHHDNLVNYVVVLEDAYRIADSLRTLNSYSKITAIKRLSRAPLSNHWDLPGTSENSDIWLLKIWSDVEQSKYKSPYVFNGGLDYTQWSLDRILRDLNFSSNIIDQAHTNENYKVRKVSSIKSLSALTFTLQDMNNLIKAKRWLYKYSMLHNKSIISAYNVVSVKKLLYPFSFTQDMLTKNFWLFNTLDLSQNTKCSNYVKNNYFTNVLPTSNLFPFIQESKVGTNINYELSYYWFLKRLYFLNSSNILDTKVANVANRNLNRLLTVNIPHSYPNNNDNFLKITTLLQKLDTLGSGNVSEIKDIFYHPVNTVFYNQNVLTISYMILSNRDLSNTGVKNYTLSSYSSILNESLTEYETYLYENSLPRLNGRFRFSYWSFLRHYVSELGLLSKKNRPASIVCGDFISSEFTKDVYRCIIKDERK